MIKSQIRALDYDIFEKWASSVKSRHKCRDDEDIGTYELRNA